jgi:hypothetical protein
MRYCFTVLFLFIALNISAQTVQDGHGRKRRLPNVTIKVSPLHLLINHYPTLQVALEHRIGKNKNMALQYDFGPVVNLGPFNMDDRDSFAKKGYKTKIELRRYLTSVNHLWLPYVSAELYYNHVDYKKSETFGVNCVGGGCDFYRLMTYKMEYREQGASFKGGVVFRVYRFCIDFQAGFSARFIQYTPVNKPNLPTQSFGMNGEDMFLPDFSVVEQSRNILSPMACIRLGFIIK